MRRTFELSSNALKNHVGEAHSTSASMKGACEGAPVGVMLGNVALLLHFDLTAKMEDFIAKLKQFSKLDFQTNAGAQRFASNDGTEDNSLFPCHLFSMRDNVWTVNEIEEVCLSAVGPLCKMTITICKLLDW